MGAEARSASTLSRRPAPEPEAVSPPPPGAPWTVLHMVKWSAAYLRSKGVDSPRLTAELLLAHVLGTKRLELYLQFDRPLSQRELMAYKPLLKRRAAREPLQYVTGTASFRALELRCDPRALIPRPETEGLLDALVAEAVPLGPVSRALDVGTGTGALALSLVGEGMAEAVVAVDLSEEALALAEENAGLVGLAGRVDWRHGELLGPVRDETFDWIVSNPPYVAEPDLQVTEPEVRDWEPRLALDGGPDGMDVIRRLVDGAGGVLAPGGWLALEVGWDQTGPVSQRLVAGGEYEHVRAREDLAGRPRYVLARKKG